MNISIVCRALIAAIFLIQIHLIPASQVDPTTAQSTGLGKKYFRRSTQLANAITPIDDILHKTNDTLSKLDQVIAIAKEDLDVQEAELQHFIACKKSITIIKECAETIIREDAELQEVAPEVAQLSMRSFINRINRKYPKMVYCLTKAQSNSALSLKNLSFPILKCVKPTLKVPNVVDTDLLAQLTKIAQLGLQFKAGCARYKHKLTALKKLETLSAYFLTQQDLKGYYAPLIEWADTGIAGSLNAYQHCQAKSLQLQQELQMQATAIPETFRIYNKFAMLKSHLDPQKSRVVLQLEKERVASLLKPLQLRETHFIETETIEYIEKAKRDANKEIAKLEELIAHAETKALEFSTSYQVLSAQEIEKEAKASNFFIIIPTMPGSHLIKGKETINAKSIFLGSNKARKIPLSKAGKANSRKGISPALSINNEDTDQKINLLFDPALPTQLWKDKNGQFYISDVAKDKDYAYPLDTILSVTVISSSQVSSTPTGAKA